MAEAGALNGFLEGARTVADNAVTRDGSVVVVLGNEAADLDSVVCAIAVALLRSRIPAEGKESLHKARAFIPVVNIPREDFALRGECVYIFGRAGVDVSQLVFIDEINLATLHQQHKLSLVLVDHNRLSSQQAAFGDVVEEIIDHHADEKLYLETTGPRRQIEVVGSCCTLVANAFFAATSTPSAPTASNPAEILDATVALLLAGGILVDTVNFLPQAAKGTPKDREVLDKLLARHLSSLDADTFFEELQKSKFSVAHLTPAQLLRRDYKEVELENPQEGKVKIGISSVPESVVGWYGSLKARGFSVWGELSSFNETRGLDGLLIMGAFSQSKGDFQRDLLLYCPQERTKLFEGLAAPLESSGLRLEAVPKQDLRARIGELKKPTLGERKDKKGLRRVWKQRDVASSRKQVMPLVCQIVSSPLQSQ